MLAPLKKGGPYEPGNVVRGEDSLRGTNYNGIVGLSICGALSFSKIQKYFEVSCICYLCKQ